MKNKKNKNDLINLDDNNEEEKEIIKEKEGKIKKETRKEKEVTKDKEVKTLKEFKDENKTDNVKKIKKEENKPSKFNIFLLIICLLLIIYLGINFYLKKDFDVNEIIKTGSFLLTLLIIVILMFKTNTKKTIPYVLLITIVLIIYTIFGTTYSEPNLYVSDFINKDISEVISFTNKYNLNLEILHEYSDTVLKNHIIMQEYGINTLISDIKDFKITVSDGPNYDKEIVVSNLTGLKYDDVIKYINENFLNNVEIEFIISSKEKDTVIEQIGSGSLKRSDLIKFVFSYGEVLPDTPLDTIKDLKNIDLFEASSYLKRLNVKYEIKYEYSNISKNKIVRQEINDDKLILVVSKGSEVKVPDLKNMTSLEISNWAFENNIKLEYIETFNKEYQIGTIIDSNYSKGDVIDGDSKLIITISKGNLVMPKIDDLTKLKLFLNENNIRYEENYQFNDTINQGELISTNFKEGDKLTPEDLVILNISKGKSIKIPNLVGKSKNDIVNICKNNNLTCTFTYGSLTENIKRDISIKQSKPSGTIVSSGTNVLITLSSGIYEKVNVPSFVNKNKNDVNNTCNSLGIKCNFSYNNSFNEKAYDTVLSQDKTGSVIKGSVVNIILSRGPAKTYTFVIDQNLLTLGNHEQTKKTLKEKLEKNCPGVTFNFIFKPVNSGIGILHKDSDIKVGQNTVVEGKTYNVIIQSSN